MTPDICRDGDGRLRVHVAGSRGGRALPGYTQEDAELSWQQPTLAHPSCDCFSPLPSMLCPSFPQPWSYIEASSWGSEVSPEACFLLSEKITQPMTAQGLRLALPLTMAPERHVLSYPPPFSAGDPVRPLSGLSPSGSHSISSQQDIPHIWGGGPPRRCHPRVR